MRTRRRDASTSTSCSKRAVAAARKAPRRGARPLATRSGWPARGSAPRGARARLRAAIENAAGIYLPDRLHEVRIAVKKLRYALELAARAERVAGHGARFAR